jgi:hypothetical protein
MFNYKFAVEITACWYMQWRTEGGLGVQPPPPRNSEVFTKLSRIPSSVENTSVTT